jgi:hypothetical protein
MFRLEIVMDDAGGYDLEECENGFGVFGFERLEEFAVVRT